MMRRMECRHDIEKWLLRVHVLVVLINNINVCVREGAVLVCAISFSTPGRGG